MFTMLFLIILATLMACASARPFAGFGARDQTVSACFLNCTTVALNTGSCSGVSDLPCLCNSVAFRNVLTSCAHQLCPDEDAATALFQAQECAPYSTLSSSQLISGTTLTSNPSITTQAPAVSATSSSPAPLSTTGATSSTQSVVSSDAFASVADASGSQGPSDHTGVIIGAVIGAIVFMIVIFFLLWWRRRARQRLYDNDLNHRLVRKSNRMSMAGDLGGVGHSYQGNDGTVQPWVYPSSSSSHNNQRAAMRPFILSTTPLTKPQEWNQNNHGYHELHSPEQDMSEISQTTASTSPRQLTGGNTAEQRLSLPPPAYQPSSISARFGSWKGMIPSTVQAF